MSHIVVTIQDELQILALMLKSPPVSKTTLRETSSALTAAASIIDDLDAQVQEQVVEIETLKAENARLREALVVIEQPTITEPQPLASALSTCGRLAAESLSLTESETR